MGIKGFKKKIRGEGGRKDGYGKSRGIRSVEKVSFSEGRKRGAL